MTVKNVMDLERAKVLNSIQSLLSEKSLYERYLFIQDAKIQEPDESRLEAIYEAHRVHTGIFDTVFGQFIMIEGILSSAKEQFEVVHEIAKLIIRPKTDDRFDNSLPEKEVMNEEAILSMQYSDVVSIVEQYIRDRDFVLFKQFAGVIYDPPVDSEESEEEEPMTPEQEFSRQWYFYSMARSLAQEDIRRLDEIYDLDMSKVLPELSFLAQKRRIEDARAREEEARQKAYAGIRRGR